MKTITLALLEKHGACSDQVALFKKTFGDEVKLTKSNLKIALAADLSFDWCECLLTDSARAEYEKVCDSARAEYEKVCGPAWAEYEKVCDSALLVALLKQEVVA